MPHFSYKAKTLQGELQEGIVEAAHADAARDALRQLNLEPEQVMLSLDPQGLPNDEMHQNWKNADVESDEVVGFGGFDHNTTKPEETTVYFPILDTLRLYAGWVLAWYVLVYGLGTYQTMRDLPFRIPFVEGLVLSPLVLSFTVASFLFLLLTDVYDRTGRGLLKGALLTFLGVVVFSGYRMLT